MARQLDLFESLAENEDDKNVPVQRPENQVAVAAKEASHPGETSPSPQSSSQPVTASKDNDPGSRPAKKNKRGRKSLKEMNVEHALISIPEDEVLFQKQYYTIGEVAEMFSLNTSLLRYWETEFDILKPRKNRKGDRYFRPEDIKNLSLIHHLLRQRKYTIEGARDYLKNNQAKARQNFNLIQRLEKLKGFLLELKAGL